MTGASSEPVAAAFFDLDKTIIAKAALAAFWGPLYDEGLLNRRSLVRALFAQAVYLHLGASELRLVRLRSVLARVAKGWRADEVREIVAEALERIVDPIIYAEAVDLIELHRARGRTVVIVSASPEEIVEPLARYLGVSLTIASRAEVDDEGRYTGQIAFYAYGPFKAEAIAELASSVGFDLGESYAYSDSFTDVPMLEAVGHPVAVNPDRVLAQTARARGWEIRRFSRPVRLRDRLRDRFPERRRGIAVSAGAIAIAAVAVVLVWKLGAARADRIQTSGCQRPFRRREATTPQPTRSARMMSFLSMMPIVPTGRTDPRGDRDDESGGSSSVSQADRSSDDGSPRR